MCNVWSVNVTSSVKMWDLRKSYVNHKSAVLPKYAFPYAGTCVRSHGLFWFLCLIMLIFRYGTINSRDDFGLIWQP